MTRLIWDDISTRQYEFGVDRGVYYPQNAPGVPWNGLISVKEALSGTTNDFVYVDGVKVRRKAPSKQFGFSVQTLSVPKELEETGGRKEFGFCFRTSHALGHRLHIIYNATGSLLDHSYTTMARGIDVLTFGWSFAARPEPIPDAAPSAHLVIDTAIGYSWMLEELETVLYGSDAGDPRLPGPVELLDIVERNAILRIINHGDGTWTAIGPDDVVSLIDSTTFQIDYKTVVYLDGDTYTVSSL